MSCTVRRLPPFERHLKAILKKFPNAAAAISSEIDSLAQHPESGFSYPGFAPFQVRKIRIGLRAYRLSAAGGLRLIFLHVPDRATVAPLVIYKKGSPGSEQDVRKLIFAALREIIAELS